MNEAELLVHAQMAFAVQAEAYFSGLYTAPLLVLLSGYIIVKMRFLRHNQTAA